MIQVILAAPDEALAEAWQSACGDLPGVSILRGSIFDAKVSALVSPANSFGFMDGGLDGRYTLRFGPGVQAQLQEMIFSHYHGELLVGQAEIVATGDERHPYLISAPTMRVPMRLPRDTVNPYLAARAALLLIAHGVFSSGDNAGRAVKEVVQSVAFPGLGTGAGGVSTNVCARQVRTAIQEVLLNEWTFPDSWAEASERHQLLYGNEVRDLQRG